MYKILLRNRLQQCKRYLVGIIIDGKMTFLDDRTTFGDNMGPIDVVSFLTIRRKASNDSFIAAELICYPPCKATNYISTEM